MSDELISCPFCGHTGIHMRRKTQMRETVTGLRYMAEEDLFDSVSLGWSGVRQYERACYDYRFGIRFWCGRCRVSPPYVWGEWHLPTEDEAEEYTALPHACDRFDPEVERKTIEMARERWNRRA